MPDISTLLQFLFEGDYLGFLQAVYVSAFQSADLFYGMVSMIIVVALYIRTQSLLFISIVWILLGSFFLIAMPIVSGIAMLLMIFGFAGLLYKAFMQIRG